MSLTVPHNKGLTHSLIEGRSDEVASGPVEIQTVLNLIVHGLVVIVEHCGLDRHDVNALHVVGSWTTECGDLLASGVHQDVHQTQLQEVESRYFVDLLNLSLDVSIGPERGVGVVLAGVAVPLAPDHVVAWLQLLLHSHVAVCVVVSLGRANVEEGELSPVGVS